MSPLEETLKNLLSRDLHVRPEEITPALVRQWLKDHPHPRSHVEFRSHYGGYQGTRLAYLTDEEIENNRKIAEAFLAQFSSTGKVSAAG